MSKSEIEKDKSHSFSYEAYQGAMMTSWNRDQPLFQLPNQLLDRLADIDVMLDKLHSTHAH